MTSRRSWNDTFETEALLGGIQYEQEGSYLWACSGQCPVWEESSWPLSWVIANFSAAAMGQPERLFQKKKHWRMWVSVTTKSALAQTHSTLGVQQMLSHINSSLSAIVIQKIPKGLQIQCLHLFLISISQVTTSEYIKKKKSTCYVMGKYQKTLKLGLLKPKCSFPRQLSDYRSEHENSMPTLGILAKF